MSRLMRPIWGIALGGAILATGVLTGSPANAAAPKPGPPAAVIPDGVNFPSHRVYVPSGHAPVGSRVTALADDPPPPPAPGPLSGTYTLSASSLWVKQQLTLIETGVTSDPAGGPVTRVVDWGDGTKDPLGPGQSTATHTYEVTGNFTVQVALTQGTLNAPGVVADPTVAITTAAVATLSKSSLYQHEVVRLSVSGVQAGTTGIAVNWGNGYVDRFPGVDGHADVWYWHTAANRLVHGTITVMLTFYNANGSSVVVAGKLTFKVDKVRPTFTLKKPKTTNRASSWRTVTGTAADTGGSGLRGAWMRAILVRGHSVYCYTTRGTWHRVYSEDELDNCAWINLKVARGKWSFKLNGLKKGSILYLDALSQDWSDKTSKATAVKAKLTK